MNEITVKPEEIKVKEKPFMSLGEIIYGLVLFVLLIGLLFSLFYKSPEVCIMKFEKALDDVRYLDNGKIIYVFGNIFVQGEMPKNDLLVKGEFMRVSNCSRSGVFKLNKESFIKVEEVK